MKPVVPRRLFYIANTFLIVVILTALSYLVTVVLDATNEVKRFNEQQGQVIEDQNNLQLCTQHDLTLAIISVSRKLGLPTNDITIPNVDGIDCEALQAR